MIMQPRRSLGVVAWAMTRAARLQKYAPLTEYLVHQDTVQHVILTFPELAAILGAPLPQAAWTAAFWSNRDSRTLGPQAWCRAGWRVVAVDLTGVPPTVTFVWAPLAPSSWQPAWVLPDSTAELRACPRRSSSPS